MGDVVGIGGKTILPIPPDEVLGGSMGECTTVLVLGWKEDGNLFAAASTSDPADLLLMLEKFRYKLIAGEYG